MTVFYENTLLRTARLSSAAAARACGERRFEVALVDVGLRNPQAVLQALNLRGRRVRRAVVLLSDGPAAPPDAIRRLGLEVVPLKQAGQALARAWQEQLPADTGRLDD